MDLRGRSVALYGRFSAGRREAIREEIARRGGIVARDLMRRSDFLVVGALATALIDCGVLISRIRTARKRGVPVLGERAFEKALVDELRQDDATFPLATVLASTPLTSDDAEILAAFDLIALGNGNCRFSDAGTIRAAGEIVAQGRSLADAVRMLLEAREHAPSGRRKLVVTRSGDAALQWDDGLSNLQGQGLLPFGAEPPGVDELFEAAVLSEAAGESEEAAGLYDMCARAERSDAIALYNLGNIRLAQKRHRDAIVAYHRALARDSGLSEARYNLAIAFEASGKLEEASAELARLLTADPDYADAVFNRAQLLMKSGEIAAARTLYERYLTLDPPADFAATARKAITYCAARLAG